MAENARIVARRLYLDARLNGPSTEHQTLQGLLSWWAARLGFVVDRSPFPGGVRPDVWRCLNESRSWKFIGEVKAWEGPEDGRVQERLFEYFCQAFHAVTRRKSPWRGFRFALAYLNRDDGEGWRAVLEALIVQAGFAPLGFSDDVLDGIPVLFWDFPPQA